MTTKLIRPGVTAATAAGPAVLAPPTEVEPAPAAELATATGTQEQGLADEPRTWWFTFPASHTFAGRYVVVHGLYDAARAEVVAHFGETFAGQFASSEEAGVLRAGLLRLRRDQWPPAVDEPAADARPAEAEHFYARGWKGDGPGECGAECACGLTYDGFDSLGAASELLDRHIADPEPDAPAELPAERIAPAEHYTVTLPQAFTYGDRELTIPAPHLADEIAHVIHAELVSVGYNGARIDVEVLLSTGAVQITWDGAVLTGAITGPGVGAHAAPPTQQEATTPAGDGTNPVPEPRRVPAGELTTDMYVATGDPDYPGVQVRHVEPAEDGSDLVGVVFTGPQYVEYDGTQLVDLIDKELVDQAAARARARAHRAQQIEALRQLADLAEQHEFFPLPPWTLRVDAGLDSTEAVRHYAAAMGVPVTEDSYGARAVWRYGGSDLTPAVQMEAAAAHRPSAGATGRATAPAQPGGDQ